MAYFITLMTPCCDYTVTPGVYKPYYNLAKYPNTDYLMSVGAWVLVTTILLTLLAYIVIIAYLIYMQLQSGQVANFCKERSILLYGILRFAIDMALALMFNFGSVINFPTGQATDLAVYAGYIVNNLIFPPMLYLILYK
ncbi:hypothetical protein L596_021168 [Steinernema carpocapsae]|uniref:G-protein coupled receptors family 1 profile domain-containing protein n=1 Tax=Steinernema carpocapsae TaxID=34508 RepID=A0A4U5MWU9_STECR|nr:hypothetical protein L596_021168 [Steinernema carpocapsae]